MNGKSTLNQTNLELKQIAAERLDPEIVPLNQTNLELKQHLPTIYQFCTRSLNQTNLELKRRFFGQILTDMIS